MSNTPRTDARCIHGFMTHPENGCTADFARELERENARLASAAQALRNEIADLLEKLNDRNLPRDEPGPES